VKRLAVLAVTLGLAALAGCSSADQDQGLDMAAVGNDLQALAQARVLLGHQSVGRNILAGVQSLAQQAGVSVRIVEVGSGAADTQPGLFHSAIGRNGDPDGKCEAFAALLDRPERPQYDVALMKFCYVDFEGASATDVEKMLDRYARMVQQLREHRPDVQLVHATVPLRADPPGWKTTVKRLIGRATDEDGANVLRNQFNTGLRQRFAREAIFDLAAAESTLPDGSRSSFTQDGRTIYTLEPRYTTDGGHLNEEGQRWVAAQFLRAVAQALRPRTQDRE